MTAPVPSIEVADNADPRSVWRPHREADPLHAVHGHRPRAKFLVETKVLALGDQIDVHLAEDRRKPVRIVDFMLAGLGVDPKPVWESLAAGATHRPREHALAVHAGKFGDDDAVVRLDHPHPPGMRKKRPHRQTLFPVLVHAEKRERIALLGGDDLLDVLFELLWRHVRRLRARISVRYRQ